MRGEGDQRGEEIEQETGKWESDTIQCQQSMAQKQQQYSKLTLQSVDSTGKAVCTFWRVKHSKVYFWGTPSFASFKLGLFFNLLIPNRSQSLDFSSSLETLELLMPARKHILLQSEEYLYSVSNTNRRFKYCSSGVFVRKGKQSERERKSACLCAEWWLVAHMKGWEYCVSLYCTSVYVCGRRCIPTGYFLFFSVQSVNNKQLNSFAEQSGILLLRKMMWDKSCKCELWTKWVK